MKLHELTHITRPRALVDNHYIVMSNRSEIDNALLVADPIGWISLEGRRRTEIPSKSREGRREVVAEELDLC